MNSQIITLKNGLRVIFIDTKAFPTVTTLLLVGAGSRYENKVNNGISHFLEHMFFKGSKKYPTPEIVSSTIEGMGGSWNAFTSKHYTGYFIKAATDHFEKSVDILSDILLNSKFEEKEIAKEKGVVTEEINMYEDQPQSRVGEFFENIMFQSPFNKSNDIFSKFCFFSIILLRQNSSNIFNGSFTVNEFPYIRSYIIEFIESSFF